MNIRGLREYKPRRDLVKKLREKQAKLIKETTSTVSFSSVINEILRKGIK